MKAGRGTQPPGRGGGAVASPSMDKLDIVPSRAGVRLRLRVKTGARQAGIAREWAGALKIAAHSPPERGRANEEICRLLAGALGVPRSAVRVVAGHTSQDKTAEVEGRDAAEVRRRLAAAAAGPE